MIIFLLFLITAGFCSTIDFVCEKTEYKDKVFLFTEGFCIKDNQQNFTSQNARLNYPSLDLDTNVRCSFDSNIIESDYAQINLKEKNGLFSSDHLVKITSQSLSFTCKKVRIKDDKTFELIEKVSMQIPNLTTLSDYVRVEKKSSSTELVGKFNGNLTQNSISFFYKGTLTYNPKNQLLQTKDAPFFLRNTTYHLEAQKAQFYLDQNSVEKIVFLGPVEIVSDTIKATCPKACYYFTKNCYHLIGEKGQPVLIWEDGALLSVRKAVISMSDENIPTITTEGTVHFSVSESEKQKVKHLIK